MPMKKIKKINKKLLLISSTGGHFSELRQLFPLLSDYDYWIVTERDKTTERLKEQYQERIHYLYYGTQEHPFSYIVKLIGNCFRSLYYYIRFRPRIVITTGAHTAGPMCCIAKLFGSKIIFIETYANATTKTITGRIVYYFADEFIVQWESMLALYPKAKYYGGVY